MAADRGRTLGATAPSRGSANIGVRASSHSGRTRQSLSTNATSSVVMAGTAWLRAAPGPPFTDRWMTVAPCRRQASATAAGSSDASSTTTTGPGSPSASRHCSRDAVRFRTGMTTVTAGAPTRACGGGTGWAMPASTSRRPSCRVAAEGVAPSSHRRSASAPARLRAISRPGCPPTSTVPSRNDRTDRSRVSPNPSGNGVTGGRTRPGRHSAQRRRVTATGRRRPGSPRR